MINNKTRLFAAVAAIAAIAGFSFSCTPSQPEPEETVSQKITASVVDNDGAGKQWASADVIGVYTDKSEKNIKYTNTATKNATSASFKASTEVKGNPQYAYYPYSTANASKAATGLTGTLPQEQVMATAGLYPYDYRYGVQNGTNNDGDPTFEFHSIFSTVCVNVNAEGTALAGKALENVIVKVTRNGAQVPVAGSFTFNAAQGTYSATSTYNEVTASWKSAKTLNGTVPCYATLFPTVKAGDVIEFTVNTADASAKVSVTTGEAFDPEGHYTFNVNAAEGEIAVPEVPVVAPELKSMKFTVAANPGKILGRKLVYQSSATTYTTRTEEVCTVNASDRTVSLYLPYLNNRNLVPTFELSEGATLTSNGEEVISGKTVVDFATYKELTVTNAAGDEAVYTVNLTNTGLPVVVVNQQTGVVTSASGDTQKGSAAWYKATGAAWQPKDSDWMMSDASVDNFMVYNADGTSAVTDKNGAVVEEPLLASTRVRGNVSQQMPKKPFAVKLDKKSGVLGMAPHKRWVLLANWSDRTLMRNAVAYDIAEIFRNTFPTDGIAWSPSGEFVELVYNGVHVGNYYLCEQVKIDSGRLDIADPYDKDDAYSGVAEDYGYLLESDDAYDEDVKFITKTYIPFQFKDDADGSGSMLAYVKGIVNGIEDNLYNGKWDEAFKTMDLASFVDFLLIQELMMNGELGYPKSVYTYIDGGKLYAGPIWDFDWQTIPNISEIESKYDNMYTNNGGKASYNFTYDKSMLATATFNRKSSAPTSVNNDDKSFMWYPMLVKNAEFKAMAAERWNAVKGAISGYADGQIPAMAAKIKKSEAENWSMWKLDSGSSGAKNRYNTYGIGGGFKGDEAMTFDNAVSTLTNNLNKRINGMSYVSNQSWPSVKNVPSYSGSSSGSGSGSGSDSGSGSGSGSGSSSGSGNWWDSFWPW